MRIAPTRALPGAPATRLKILVAGLDKDGRAPVEARVRRALALRSTTETWAVSLVKLGSRWSVTLNGPSDSTRHLSLTTDDSGLEHAIRQAVGADAPPPGAAVPASHAPAEHAAVGPAAKARPDAGATQQRHVCRHCSGALVVSYESRPGEEKQLAPVACPYCWQLDHVEIGAWAAAGADYRCDKAAPAAAPADRPSPADRPQAS
jgi:hypothetical protein